MDNTQNIKFIEVAKTLGDIIKKPTSDPMEGIKIMNTKQYGTFRTNIAKAFKVGDVKEFTGKVCNDLELGDVACKVYDTLIELYPPKITKVSRIIPLDERKIWCDNILTAIDQVALES